jgi:hypothetical protein
LAKYKLKASLVATLKSRGIVDVNDMMTLRLPHRGNGEVETAFEVTFNVTTEALETTNRITMNAIEQKHGPKIKVGAAQDWWAGDPSVSWFETLAPEDVTPTQTIDLDGTEIVTKYDRSLMQYWSNATQNALPGTWDKGDTAVHLGNAVAHRATWWD